MTQGRCWSSSATIACADSRKRLSPAVSKLSGLRPLTLNQEESVIWRSRSLTVMTSNRSQSPLAFISGVCPGAENASFPSSPRLTPRRLRTRVRLDVPERCIPITKICISCLPAAVVSQTQGRRFGPRQILHEINRFKYIRILQSQAKDRPGQSRPGEGIVQNVLRHMCAAAVAGNLHRPASRRGLAGKSQPQTTQQQDKRHDEATSSVS